jgi:hypothetical protein
MFRVSEDNELGYIQCVIKPIHKDSFERIGFRDSLDSAKKVKPKIVKKPKAIS